MPQVSVRLALACAGAAAVVVAMHGAAAQQPPSLGEITTEVISVPVTVLDRNGRFVPSLKKEDFELFEDRAAQTINSLAIAESGVAAELLIDVSGSMGLRIGEAKRAATEFVRQLGPNDVARVIQFDEKVTPLGEFSNDRAQLEAQINSAKIGGATALYNAISRALADLNARRNLDDKRHRAIIILTDGEDTASAERPDDVLIKARRLDAMVYSLSLDRVDGRPVTDNPSAVFLRELADATGGSLDFPQVGDLQKLYRQLADELRHQYVLGYQSTNREGPIRWRTITVRVKNRNNLRLRHRLGYFPGAARSTQ